MFGDWTKKIRDICEEQLHLESVVDHRVNIEHGQVDNNNMQNNEPRYTTGATGNEVGYGYAATGNEYAANGNGYPAKRNYTAYGNSCTANGGQYAYANDHRNVNDTRNEKELNAYDNRGFNNNGESQRSDTNTLVRQLSTNSNILVIEIDTDKPILDDSGAITALSGK